MEQCLSIGAEIVSQCHEEGCNVISFGEMGIGNTSPSSMWMTCLTGIPLFECVGAAPASWSCANGLVPGTRAAPRRSAYMPCAALPTRRRRTVARSRRRPGAPSGRCPRGRPSRRAPVAAWWPARCRGRPGSRRPRSVEHGVHPRVTDDVEAALHTGGGTGRDVVSHSVGRAERGAGTPGIVSVGLAQQGRS